MGIGESVGGTTGGGSSSALPIPNTLAYPHLHRALARVQSGTGDAKTALVGDSTTYGYGSSQDGIGPAIYVADTLAASSYPSAVGLAIANVPSGLGTDARWTKTSAWTTPVEAGWSFGGINPTYTAPAGTGADTLAYAPGAGVLYDTFDIYYFIGPGFGTFQVNLNFGTNTPVVCAAGSNGIAKTTITGTALDINTVFIGPVTVGGVTIAGIEPSLSTMAKVRIANCGVEGATTTSWTLTSSPGIGPLDAIKAYAPDISIIMLGINDQAAATSVATYLANLLVIATACGVSGDVLIASPWPTQASTAGSLCAQYTAALAAFCAQHGFEYIPLFEQIGGTGAYAELQPLGFYFDVTHPTDQGYSDYARLYSDWLLAA